jgi:hypothetical protein
MPACLLADACHSPVSPGITAFPPGLGELRLLEGLQADGCALRAPFTSL